MQCPVLAKLCWRKRLFLTEVKAVKAVGVVSSVRQHKNSETCFAPDSSLDERKVKVSPSPIFQRVNLTASPTPMRGIYLSKMETAVLPEIKGQFS